jgi:hypothetical protein
MLGHNDPGPEIKTVPLSGAVDGIDKPKPASVFAQERLTPEAGERESVRVAGLVDTPAGFPMAEGNFAHE